MKAAVFTSSIAVLSAQQKGMHDEVHPELSWSTCTSSGQCQLQAGKVVIDANWRWIHKVGESTNCYSGNMWDAEICPDTEICTQNCVIEGIDDSFDEYEGAYGVKASGNYLKLGFVTKGMFGHNVGARTFLMEDDHTYKLFKLKNKEFTYTVDDSNLDCGLNGALYFVQMDADGGKSKYGNAGAELGLGYCNADCPHDLKFINGEANMEDWEPSATAANAGFGKYGSCCTEINVWEANKMAAAYTMRACSAEGQTRCEGVDCGDYGPDRFDGICDANGCDLQPHRLGLHDFFGPGPDFQIDSTQPLQVTTQFITHDGTDHGKLVEVKQFYSQNGKTVHHPKYWVNGKMHSSITEDFCAAWIETIKDGTNFLDRGGLDAVDKAIDAGVVLVMSLWDDHYANMLWLDSTYPAGSSAPGAFRGNCGTDTGVPEDVEREQADAQVVFSDIRFGPIGSTTESVSMVV